MTTPQKIVIIGAGAAGLMAAISAANAGADVLLMDHGKKIGAKILISGGGRCNFTNLYASPDRFLSENKHFHKSALARFTPDDFLVLMRKHDITWHEKTLGQLFCDEKAPRVVQMLLDELKASGAKLRLNTAIETIEKTASGFSIKMDQDVVEADKVIIATGGKSIPNMGATGFAYKIAEQFGIEVTETRPALVPLTFSGADLDMMSNLSGVSAEVVISIGKTTFRENILFTHRGLSGPAVLQISSYWREGEDVIIDLLPDIDIQAALEKARNTEPRRQLSSYLISILPKRLVSSLFERFLSDTALANLSNKQIAVIADQLKRWRLKPSGSEGYRTAEVTLGGVSTASLSSKTLEAKNVPGLYFVGECVDVTGWLGGYNFQWAWASGFAAGLAASKG